MSVLSILARFALAAVFATAGVTKLLDRSGARASMRGFGVPESLAGISAVLLPMAELLVAEMLVWVGTAVWAALGALMLLALFSVAIAANMALGRAPDCHCFGQLHSEPAGWSTLARNVALGLVAGFVLWTGAATIAASSVAASSVPVAGSSLFGNTTVPLLVALVIVQALVALVVVYQLLAQNGRILARLDAVEARLGITQLPSGAAGLPVGVMAPNFDLPSTDGSTVSLGSLRSRGAPLLLIFTGSACGACDALMPDVAGWQRQHLALLSVVVISAGTLEAARAKAASHQLQHVLVQPELAVSEAYRVGATPSAVLVKDGLIASALATGTDAIRELVDTATERPPLSIGDQVPALALRQLEGGTFDLASLRGNRTVLLFWNASCGFCQAMLDNIKAWEATRGADGPELIVISAGSPKTNREQGFRSRVLLDPKFAAGHLFGAEGTPAAVLIDADRRVASPPSVGADAVLFLLGARAPVGTRA